MDLAGFPGYSGIATGVRDYPRPKIWRFRGAKRIPRTRKRVSFGSPRFRVAKRVSKVANATYVHFRGGKRVSPNYSETRFSTLKSLKSSPFKSYPFLRIRRPTSVVWEPQSPP